MWKAAWPDAVTLVATYCLWLVLREDYLIEQSSIYGINTTHLFYSLQIHRKANV